MQRVLLSSARQPKQKVVDDSKASGHWRLASGSGHEDIKDLRSLNIDYYLLTGERSSFAE